MRQIDIIATQDGIHYLEFGFNASELATFSIQMWITKTGARAVDWLQSLSLGYVSFMGGNIWKHNSDDVDRLSLFGEAKECKIGVVANDQPNLVKILDTLGLHTDGEWEVESVTIPATLNYPDGMYSRIPKENFVKREGVYQSEFLRNMKTSSSTISQIEAITGEALRGQVAYILLKHSSTSKVRLWKVDVNMSKSR
jgi:hypothetical protein